MLWLLSLPGLLRSRLGLSLVGLLGALRFRLLRLSLLGVLRGLLRLGLMGLLGVLRLRLLRLSLLCVLRGLWLGLLGLLGMLRLRLLRLSLLGVHLLRLLRLSLLGVLLLRLLRLTLFSWLLVRLCLRAGRLRGWPRCLLWFTLLLFRLARFRLILRERRGNGAEKQTQGRGTGNSKDFHANRLH